jgi:replicative superfamily II helicase
VDTYENILESLLSLLQENNSKFLIIDEIQLIREDFRSPVLNAILKVYSELGTRGRCVLVGSYLSDENIEDFKGRGYHHIVVRHWRFLNNIIPYSRNSLENVIREQYLLHLSSRGLVRVFVHTKRDIFSMVSNLNTNIKNKNIGIPRNTGRIPIFHYMGESRNVKYSLGYRIGIHFRGVEHGYLKFIESLLSKGEYINILFTTTTLAEGINIPNVRTEIMAYHDHLEWTRSKIVQMIGRTNRFSSGRVFLHEKSCDQYHNNQFHRTDNPSGNMRNS